MNREEALQRAIELKGHSQEFESVSFIDDDTEFFEYVIKELERTAPEVPVQEQSVVINLKINNRFSLQKLLNQLGNNHTLGHRR